MGLGPTVRELTAPGHAGVAPPDGHPASPPVAPQRDGGGAGSPRFPRPGMPAKSDMDYLKVAVELVLLLIAVPYVLRRLITNPAGAARASGKKHLG